MATKYTKQQQRDHQFFFLRSCLDLSFDDMRLLMRRVRSLNNLNERYCNGEEVEKRIENREKAITAMLVVNPKIKRIVFCNDPRGVPLKVEIDGVPGNSWEDHNLLCIWID